MVCDTLEVKQQFLERADANEMYTGDEIGLIEVVDRDINLFEVGVFGRFDDIDNTADRAD